MYKFLHDLKGNVLNMCYRHMRGCKNNSSKMLFDLRDYSSALWLHQLLTGHNINAKCHDNPQQG